MFFLKLFQLFKNFLTRKSVLSHFGLLKRGFNIKISVTVKISRHYHMVDDVWFRSDIDCFRVGKHVKAASVERKTFKMLLFDRKNLLKFRDYLASALCRNNDISFFSRKTCKKSGNIVVRRLYEDIAAQDFVVFVENSREIFAFVEGNQNDSDIFGTRLKQCRNKRKRTHRFYSFYPERINIR